MTHLERFQKRLDALGADGAIVSSEINQRYLSNFDYSDGYILVTPKEAYLLTDSRYVEAAKATVRELDVICVKGGMLSELQKLLERCGLSRILVEEDALSYSAHARFSETFAGVTVLSGASKALGELRAIKDAGEIACIAEAQKITDAAFEHILNFITPERTELEVALELEFFMRRHGSEGVAFDTITVSGPASSLPHGVPSDVKLREGFLTMDFGARVDGYCSDMTRTVVIGHADEEMKRIYDTVLSAQAAALDGMRGGMRCRDADEIARRIIRDAGYGECFGHSLGHGVGLFIHEFPRISPKASETSVLEAGHVVTVEPGIYIEGKYGCRIEDMVAIRDDGSVMNFTASTKDLIEL